MWNGNWVMGKFHNPTYSILHASHRNCQYLLWKLRYFSHFRNFNKEIFTRRPEFCLLYEKLQKTCKHWKRDALTEKYPDLCSTINEVKESIVICPPRQANTSVKLDPILFRLNGSLLKLRDELYVYARDNLAVVNIYIKDATVTKIRRDQKVIFETNFHLSADNLGL